MLLKSGPCESQTHAVDYFVCVCVCVYLHRVRELTTAKIGSLLKISGQVVRTHPVHPELVSGSFLCLECQTLISDVEQQFKFTQVHRCIYIYIHVYTHVHVHVLYTCIVHVYTCTCTCNSMYTVYTAYIEY